jgi:hypothetical protein
VTRFTAPLLMLVFGCQSVARLWALVLAGAAIAFGWPLATIRSRCPPGGQGNASVPDGDKTDPNQSERRVGTASIVPHGDEAGG